MNENMLPGLAEYCRAIREDDEGALAERRRNFVAHNWPLVAALDQLAQAETGAGQHQAALHKLELLEQLLPDHPSFYLRRVHEAARAGRPEAAEELVRAPERLHDGHLLVQAVDQLLGSGYFDEAMRLIEASASLERHSDGVFVICRARILAACGRLQEALDLITPLAEQEPDNLLAAHTRFNALERLAEFNAALEVVIAAALRLGDQWSLQLAIHRIAYLYDFDAASALLNKFEGLHPAAAEAVERLRRQVLQPRAEAEAAVAEHGPPTTADTAAIYDALSKPGISPSRVMWGKLSLSAFLRQGAMTEAEYIRFAWFLPSWEEAEIRHRLLAVARRSCPDAPAVQRAWLKYLIASGAYGDAAQELGYLIGAEIDEGVLFFLVVLLRLQHDATLPSFMEPELFEALRQDLWRRIPASDPGFRCVMHDHFVALGWVPQPWPDDAMPGHEQPEAAAFRRLFAVSTGRLSGALRSAAAGAPRPPRAVLAISGQLRGFETTWPSILDRLCRPAGAPVVMSVWDKSVNAMGRHARRLERMLPGDVVARLRPEERYTDTFEANYPHTAQLLFGRTDVDAPSLRALIDGSGCDVLAVETESEAMIERLMPPYISANMLKMYYKFSRLEALVREREVQSGEVFSHVIWARPDSEITQLAARDLRNCLERPDIAWSSFVAENSFGDYLMVLPRPAFAAIASIFPRVCLAGDTRLLPWRPSRLIEHGSTPPQHLAAFGGPDVLFDILLAAGYLPLHRIPRAAITLRGRTPGAEIVRAAFDAEHGTARN